MNTNNYKSTNIGHLLKSSYLIKDDASVRGAPFLNNEFDLHVKNRGDIKYGSNESYGHLGEYVQMKHAGQIIVASVPAPIFKVRVQVQLIKNKPLLIFPANKSKALNAAKEALKLIGCENYGGIIIVEANLAYPESKGAGKSTSECAAVIKAICNALSRKITTYKLGKLLVKAEKATDGSIFEEDVVFFKSRNGEVDSFLGENPDVWILGWDAMPEETVDTLGFTIPNYSFEELYAFKSLYSDLKTAIEFNDLELLGYVSTQSAEKNQRYLKKPHFEEIKRISKAVDSYGIVTAHTGTLCGLIFSDISKTEKAKDELRDLGFKEPFWVFQTNEG